jgi:hypothetical protein
VSRSGHPPRRLRWATTVAVGGLVLGVVAMAAVASRSSTPAPAAARVQGRPVLGSQGPSGDGTATAAADGGMTRQDVSGDAASTAGTPTPAVPAHTYYVNCTTGSDAGTGSARSPWRTLGPVRARTFPPDSGVYLARGCTWNEPLEVTGGRSATAGVLVTAYGGGARPLVTGTGDSGASVVSLLSPRVVLSGIAVRFAARYGIQMFGDHDVVRDVVVSDSGDAVRAMGAADLIDHVQVHDLHMIVNTPGGNDDFGAVGYDVEAPGVEISNSSCTNCRAPSYDYGHDGGFVEIWDHGDNLYVHGNVASNTDGFLEVGGDLRDGSARNVRVVGNTMNEVHGGFFVHSTGVFAITAGPILVSGNRITNREASTDAVFGGDVGTMDVVNNVVIANQPIAFHEPAAHEGNVFYVQDLLNIGFPLAPSEAMKPLATAP